MKQIDFVETIFDYDDQVCFALNPYDTNLLPVSPSLRSSIGPFIDRPYFAINALQNTRTDANVTKHRTFMLEFDSMPLEDQIPYVIASRLPVTAIVYSGNKSYHFFVTLKEPVSRAEYACIAQRLHLLLPEADKTTKNPSRLARLPHTFRPDTGKEQRLIDLNGRIALADLLQVLPELPQRPIVEPKIGSSVFQRTALIEARKHPNEVMKVLGIAGRNAFFYWLGKRLEDDLATEDFKHDYLWAVYEALEDKSDFTWKEAMTAARIN